jgi:hypothetical protein
LAVPRKRKKLAETANELKQNGSKSQRQNKPQKTVKISARNSSKKIDNAFEIMEHIEKETSAEKTIGQRSNSTKSASPLERLGFRFHISLDAVMPEEKGNRNKTAVPLNKSSILDIGLTIPFFWKMPIIGGIAQKVVQSIKTLKF